MIHATVDSVEAVGKIVTYPTKVDEYSILKHLTARLKPPAAVPRPLCRAEGEYRGVLTEKISGDTLATLWAKGEGPPPELVGEAVKELHKALETLETPWCRPGIAGEEDVAEWGLRPCLRAGLAAALSVAVGSPATLEAVDAILTNCGEIAEMAGSSLGVRKQCIHGDLHLDQLIWDGRTVYFTDFAGEPLRWPAPQACAEPPERDLAALLTSTHYITKVGGKREEWEIRTAENVLSGYGLHDTGRLRFWIIERASYELVYEIAAGTGLESIPADTLVKALTTNQWPI